MTLGEEPVTTYHFNQLEVICLPARTKILVKLKIESRTKAEGYIRHINAGLLIYFGETIVSNENGCPSR